MTTTAVELRPGAEIGRCRIEAPLGAGGMGVVYLARDLDLDRRVAVKLIRGEHVADPSAQERFKREAKIAAQLYHPNVAVVHRVGEESGLLFCVMQWIDGVDLRQLIVSETRLDPSRAAKILAQIGSALDKAHERRLLHRDVKSSNILISREKTHEHAFLSDFGIARRMSTSIDDEHVSIAGSPGYIAPERIKGDREDPRSDVYSLGCVLCEALTGTLPYPRASTVEVLVAHMNEPPPPVSDGNDGVSPSMDLVIQRALAKDPADRYLTAGDLGRAALEAVEGSRRRTTPRAARRGKRPKADIVVGLSGGDFTSINDAISAATPGASIGVRRGFYRESVVLDLNNLHLFADGPREEVIVCASGRKPTLVCAADDCAVSWLTLNYTPRLPNPLGWCVRVRGHGVALERCVVSSDSAGGLRIEKGATADIRKCRIRGGTRAIEVTPASDALLEGNYVYGSGYTVRFMRSVIHGDGIYVGAGARAIVVRNKLVGVVGEGVIVAGTAELRHNDIVSSCHSGVLVLAGGRAEMAANQVHDGHEVGIRVERGADVSIEDNDVFANRGAAILVARQAAGAIRLNRIYANGRDTVIVDEAASALARDNDVREDLTSAAIGTEG